MKYGPKMRSGDLSKLKNDLRRQENDLRRLPPSLKWLPKSPDIRTSISQNMHQCKGAGSRVLYPCTTGTTGTLAQYYLHMCTRWSLLVKIWHSLLNCSAYSYFPLAFGRFGTLELELGSASE